MSFIFTPLFQDRTDDDGSSASTQKRKEGDVGIRGGVWGIVKKKRKKYVFCPKKLIASSCAIDIFYFGKLSLDNKSETKIIVCISIINIGTRTNIVHKTGKITIQSNNKFYKNKSRRRAILRI